jgi:quercetin dioxygenase-like cupin family protein
MKKTVTKLSSTGVAALGCVCVGATIAHNPAVVRKELMSAQLDPVVQTIRVEVKSITMAPGVKAGLHLHPCPVVGVITHGTISFQIEGEEMQTLRSGDAFFEPANRRVTRFDNDGSRPAVFTAFYLVSHEDQELIKLLLR